MTFNDPTEHTSSTMAEETPLNNIPTTPTTIYPLKQDLDKSLPQHEEPDQQQSTSTNEKILPKPGRKLRVAVVGSGLAGLTIAHILSSLHSEDGHGEEGVEVELFEKAHKLGKQKKA